MKNLMNTIVSKAAGKAKADLIRTQMKFRQLKANTGRVLCQQSGEGFVDSALKILISVVIGALLLSGLYMLFKDTVIPTLVQRVEELFNYAG